MSKEILQSQENVVVPTLCRPTQKEPRASGNKKMELSSTGTAEKKWQLKDELPTSKGLSSSHIECLQNFKQQHGKEVVRRRSIGVAVLVELLRVALEFQKLRMEKELLKNTYEEMMKIVCW